MSDERNKESDRGEEEAQKKKENDAKRKVISKTRDKSEEKME